MNEDWIYIGIFLDEKSKKKLKKLYPTPDGWKEYYDHMTVVFNDGTDIANAVKSINMSKIGCKATLRIIGTGISDKAFAVKVSLPEGIVCANKIAHITLATSKDGNAVDSNFITNWSNIYSIIEVTGKIEIYKPVSQFFKLDHDKVDEANIY